MNTENTYLIHTCVYTGIYIYISFHLYIVCVMKSKHTCLFAMMDVRTYEWVQWLFPTMNHQIKCMFQKNDHMLLCSVLIFLNPPRQNYWVAIHLHTYSMGEVVYYSLAAMPFSHTRVNKFSNRPGWLSSAFWEPVPVFKMRLCKVFADERIR